jgi:dienelactone hydrolase
MRRTPLFMSGFYTVASVYARPMRETLRAALLVASVAVAGCASATVSFENATPGAALRIRAEEFRPGGAGRFPAVVLMHGCHGVSESNREWARWFAGQGYVALVVDSWRPRGLSEACTPGEELPSSARLDDAIGALRWLHGRPYVDRERVGIIGWSNGGVFAMAAVNGPTFERTRKRGVEIPEPGFRAAVGVYPGGCFTLEDELSVRPLLLLIGGADDWTLASECAELTEKQRAKGADVTLVIYPGAVHYFDVVGQPRTWLADVENRNRPNNCCGATVGYDAAAAADAHRRVAEFFGRHLGSLRGHFGASQS